MYLEHYGLAEPPFSITPDPRFVFLSERHRDALAHLSFGIGQGGGGGFVQLTGEVGTGKTTLSRLLLEQLPENTRVALVLNPRVSALELLETLCEELHLDIDGKRGSSKALIDALNAYLLDAYAQGLRVVLIVDEAQNLSVEALEQVRLLTNLETDKQKLLQILLLGQPELRAMLAREDLRQLAQRITARYHLTPLDADETAQYLRHRYRVAGGQRFPFTGGAVKRVHARSGGVPRLINVIAERALLAGYARDADLLDRRIVDAAANEALSTPSFALDRWAWLAASAVALLGVVALWVGFSPRTASDPVVPQARASVPVAAPAAVRVPRAETLDDAAFAQRLRGAVSDPLPAWKRLLEGWGLPPTRITVDADGGCTPVPDAQLHCLRGRGGLDKLLALDRPALLPLRDGTATAWAVLLGADARRARVAIDGRSIDVDRLALQAHWDGRYFALWRGPDALAVPIQPGTGGAAAAWVRARVLSGSEASQAGAGYDAATADAVRRFQSARGLFPDGVAGPETLMALADDAGPQLLRTLE